MCGSLFESIIDLSLSIMSLFTCRSVQDVRDKVIGIADNGINNKSKVKIT